MKWNTSGFSVQRSTAKGSMCSIHTFSYIAILRSEREHRSKKILLCRRAKHSECLLCSALPLKNETKMKKKYIVYWNNAGDGLSGLSSRLSPSLSHSLTLRACFSDNFSFFSAISYVFSMILERASTTLKNFPLASRQLLNFSVFWLWPIPKKKIISIRTTTRFPHFPPARLMSTNERSTCCCELACHRRAMRWSWRQPERWCWWYWTSLETEMWAKHPTNLSTFFLLISSGWLLCWWVVFYKYLMSEEAKKRATFAAAE